MRYKVLIIDDEWTIARVLSARLKAHGFEVFTAPDGLAALPAARECRPDCILLDVRMPEIDGLEVLARLRCDNGLAATPTFVLTGDATDEVRRRAETLGAAGLFKKPFHHQQVIDAILATLAEASKQGAHS